MKKYLPIILATLPLLALPIISHAQTFVPLAETATQGSRLADLYSSNNLADYINKIFTAAIAIGAVAAVLRLSYAGYLYMGQADMWSKKGEAKAVIGDVTLGLLLLLSIWLILNQINPDILKLNALKNIKPVNQTQGGASAASMSPYTGVPAATENSSGVPVDQSGTPLQ